MSRRPRPPELGVAAGPGIHRFRVWGTGGTLAVQPSAALGAARAVVARELAAFDAACNRFRGDAELTRLNAGDSSPRRISPLLFTAVATALRVAEATAGAVDPTVGRSVVDLGYDRDLGQLAGRAHLPLTAVPAPAPGWRCVELDAVAGTLAMPTGVCLDLGATAKALCADRAAAAVHAALGTAALVDLGGDLAIAGPPPAGGWHVSVVDDAGAGQATDQCVVAVWGGGMASSGTTARRWSRAGHDLHHIVDPATGWPCRPVWRMVTVAGGSAVDANAAATAAVVWGEDAPYRVGQMGLPARFVSRRGAVLEVAGWPAASSSAGVPAVA